MTIRQNITTGTPWESIVGYSRVVRMGALIFVAGTTATDAEGNYVGIGNPYLQTVAILEKIKAALQQVGAGLENVVRTRIYVTNIQDWQQIAQAHREFFGEIKPVSTMVEINRLIAPELLVEIEVDAMIE